MSVTLVQNQYINYKQLQEILDDLTYAPSETAKQDLLNRATSDMEADLSSKFQVPLVFSSVGFETYSTVTIPWTTPPAAYKFAIYKVLSLLNEKIREIIGYNKNRNLLGTIENTQKFINVHGEEYKKLLNEFLDSDIYYGLQMQKWAVDSRTPIQHVALARADDDTHEDRCLSLGRVWP